VQIFSGQVPFYEIRQDYSVIVPVIQGKRPEFPAGDSSKSRGLNTEVWTLIEACWAQDPMQRPIVEEIVERLRSLPHRLVDHRPLDNFHIQLPTQTLCNGDEHLFSAIAVERAPSAFGTTTAKQIPHPAASVTEKQASVVPEPTNSTVTAYTSAIATVEPNPFVSGLATSEQAPLVSSLVTAEKALPSSSTVIGARESLISEPATAIQTPLPSALVEVPLTSTAVLPTQTPIAPAATKPASLSSTPSTAEQPLVSAPAEKTPPTSSPANVSHQIPLASTPSTTERVTPLTSALTVGQTSFVSNPATTEQAPIEPAPVIVEQKPVMEDFNAGSIPNVVIFGEVGVGKSSVVNMIAGRQVAQPSIGCTYQSEPHAVNLGATLVKLWVTTGLNEEDAGTARAKHTIVDLYKLLQRLEDGISLLVYCVRGPGINLNSITRNYRMFYHGLCQRNVPIVLVVTGLEGERPMDAWWPMNNAIFQQQQMVFSGQACITATRGQFEAGVYAFEKEYEESRTKVQKLIGDCSRGAQRKIRASNWVVDTVKSTINIFSRMLNVPLRGLSSSLHEVLTDYGGFSEEQAQKIVDEVEAVNSPADDEKRNPWSEMYDWTHMI